ncbi:MAG: sigma-E processing peptidase SpoIIGA [Bacillota bacterium]|nr:sigma-E processing peptidase SpoIIGA [Bacillota bacterium]
MRIVTIYVDVLVCVNMFINYFILLSVAKFRKIEYKFRRLILASLFGAFCALIILLPPISSFLNCIYNIVTALIIILIAFKKTNLKAYLKNAATFYLVSFAFCGLMLGVWFCFTPKNMMVKNNVVYFNISPMILVITTLICYFALKIITRITGKSMPKKLICKVSVLNRGNNSDFSAKLDTGNSLYEPFSHSPVIVTDIDIVKNIIPKEIQNYLFATVGGQNTETNLRLVPFSSVGGEGVLPAFRPEQISIDGKLCHQEIYIAVCKEGVLNGEFKALLNEDLLNE